MSAIDLARAELAGAATVAEKHAAVLRAIRRARLAGGAPLERRRDVAVLWRYLDRLARAERARRGWRAAAGRSVAGAAAEGGEALARALAGTEAQAMATRGTITIAAARPRENGAIGYFEATIEAEIYGAFAAHAHARFTAAGEVATPDPDSWGITHVATGRAFGFACAPEVARAVARRASALPGVDALTALEDWQGAEGDRYADLLLAIIREELAITREKRDAAALAKGAR